MDLYILLFLRVLASLILLPAMLGVFLRRISFPSIFLLNILLIPAFFFISWGVGLPWALLTLWAIIGRKDPLTRKERSDLRKFRSRL